MIPGAMTERRLQTKVPVRRDRDTFLTPRLHPVPEHRDPGNFLTPRLYPEAPVDPWDVADGWESADEWEPVAAKVSM
jgi:hypothetical protein